jgi:hypothetical protein
MMKITGIILMELKYCEQCGGIWLRCQGSGEDLCQRPLCGGAVYRRVEARAQKQRATTTAGTVMVRGPLDERQELPHGPEAGREESAMRPNKALHSPGEAGRPIDQAFEHPDLWLYRDYVISILKRYFRLAVETGRLPSVLGREYFRTRVTSERGYTFENSVIFVHDVEHCLEELDDFSREVIGWHVLQEFSLKETAHLMGCGQSAAYRGFLEALDRLSEIMLTHQLMTPVEAAEDVGDPEMRTCVS